MKQKLITITKVLLTSCMAFSWWVGCKIPSLVILGEYAYPSQKEN